MTKEVQQLEITTNLIRNLKGYSDERIKREGLDRKDVLTASDKTVLVAISTWINVTNNLRNGVCSTNAWVTQETICEQTLLSKRTVQDCINKLIRLGNLVQVKKGRTGVASEYTIVLSEAENKPVKKVQQKQTTPPQPVYLDVDESDDPFSNWGEQPRHTPVKKFNNFNLQRSYADVLNESDEEPF